MPVNIRQNGTVTAPAGLFVAIVRRIDAERKALSLRQRFVFAAVLLAGTSAVFLFAWHGFKADFISSGFGQYLSLLFSDFRAVMSDWQDFGLTLLESFPVVSAMEVLAILFTLLWALKYTIKYSKSFFIQYFLQAK